MTDTSPSSNGWRYDPDNTEARLHDLERGIDLEGLIAMSQEMALVYGGKTQTDLIIPRNFSEGLIITSTAQQTAHNFAAVRLFPRHGLVRLCLPGQEENPKVSGKEIDVQHLVTRRLFNTFVNYRGFRHTLGNGVRRFGLRAIDINDGYRYHPEYAQQSAKLQFKDLIDELQANRLLIYTGKAKARSYILSPNVEVVFGESVVNEGRLVREVSPPPEEPREPPAPPVSNITPSPLAPMSPLVERSFLPKPTRSEGVTRPKPETPKPKILGVWQTNSAQRERIRLAQKRPVPIKPANDRRMQERLQDSERDKERQSRLANLKTRLSEELTDQEVKQVDALMKQQSSGDGFSDRSVKRAISRILESGFDDDRLPKFTKDPRAIEKRAQQRKSFRMAMDEARAKWGLTDDTVDRIRILREFEKRVWVITSEE